MGNLTMNGLPIMRDLPIELIRFNNDIRYQIIFDETYFIKKIMTDESNIETLKSLCDLDIVGFNNHKKIFIDGEGLYIYLVSKYLDESSYKNTYKTILTMSAAEILSLFKIMLERLIPAHQKNFNPYDLKYSNYLLDKDNNPVFTDFDCCFYKGECTYQSAYSHYEPNFDFAKQTSLRDSLMIHDKMEILKLFLHSICSSSNLDLQKIGNKNVYEILNYLYEIIKANFIIPKEADEYLSDLIFNKMLPKDDDYFIENLIKPLEKGLDLKM